MSDAVVVIVNYRTPELVERCVASVRATGAGLELETVIVDNASRDGSVERLRAALPHATVRRACPRTAASRPGVNAGFAHSRARARDRAQPRHRGASRRPAGVAARACASSRERACVAPLLEDAEGQLAANGYRRFPGLLTVALDLCIPLRVRARPRPGAAPLRDVAGGAARGPRPGVGLRRRDGDQAHGLRAGRAARRGLLPVLRGDRVAAARRARRVGDRGRAGRARVVTWCAAVARTRSRTRRTSSRAPCATCACAAFPSRSRGSVLACSLALSWVNAARDRVPAGQARQGRRPGACLPRAAVADADGPGRALTSTPVRPRLPAVDARLAARYGAAQDASRASPPDRDQRRVPRAADGRPRHVRARARARARAARAGGALQHLLQPRAGARTCARKAGAGRSS